MLLAYNNNYRIVLRNFIRQYDTTNYFIEHRQAMMPMIGIGALGALTTSSFLFSTLITIHTSSLSVELFLLS